MHECLHLQDPLCMTYFVQTDTVKAQHMLYTRMLLVGVQAMRFGASPAACRQAMSLGFEWSMQQLSSAAQEDLKRNEQHAQQHMQKVDCTTSSTMFPHVTL